MSWDTLQQLRKKGLKPSLPVVVTTDGKRPAWLLESIGCLVVKHESGQAFPVKLLDGLQVWLFLGNCDRAQAVVRAMKAKGVVPSQLRAWCPCAGAMDSMPVNCDVAREWAAA
jgi:hypothetical protein